MNYAMVSLPVSIFFILLGLYIFLSVPIFQCASYSPSQSQQILVGNFYMIIGIVMGIASIKKGIKTEKKVK